MPPLVSIIIPCYNAESWVTEAIESCLKQTYSKLEIIVVDDGSTDGSLKIIQSFGERIRLETGPNRGGNVARNRGFAMSKGSFIQYLDADDILDSRKIEMQINRLLQSTPDTVASAAWARFFDAPVNARFRPEPVWCDTTPIDWLVKAWHDSWMMPPHAWLTPRKLVEAAGGWDESLVKYQDGEFFTRVLLRSAGIVFCPEARVYYRSGIPGSVSRNTSGPAATSMLRYCELCAENLLKVENSPRTREAAAALFQHFIYDIYPAHGELTRLAEAKIASLGGIRLPLRESVVFNALAGVFGWKLARRMQNRFRKIRYGK